MLTLDNFQHDLIQQAVYESMPINERRYLHRTIGMNLLGAANNNQSVHMLAVDQINIFAKGYETALSPEERRQYAEINATAAEQLIAASTHEQGVFPFIYPLLGFISCLP